MNRYFNLIKNNPLMVAVKFARYKFIAKLLQKSDNVLEVGCSDGTSSNFFSQYCNKIDALDMDKELLNEAKKSFPEINFMYKNALEYQTDKKYDVIILLDFIEHFTQKDGVKLVEKYSSMLSDKGMLIVGTPSKYFDKYRAEHNKAHHLHEYYPDELEKLMQKYFDRTMMFAMNDEIVHTGNINLAWFIYSIGTYKKT